MIQVPESFLIQNQELKEKVWDVIFSTVEIFKDIPKVDSIIMADVDRELRELKSNSLSSGYPGVCLLLGALDNMDPDGEWDIVAFEYLKRVQAHLQTGSFHSLSLFHGLAGIMMGVEACSRNNSRYQVFLKQLSKIFLEHYPAVLQDSFKRIQSGVKIDDYDIISGWAGIGRCLLVFSEQPQLYRCVKDIINYMVQFVNYKQLSNPSSQPWHISRENLFLEDEKKIYPSGNFNCGLSHGIAGVLAFLSIAAQHGLVVSGQYKAIEKIATWLINWIQEDEGIKFIPNVIKFEDHIIDTYTDGFNHRDAWCYGSPGVARTLWISGNICKREDWKSEALILCKSTFQRSQDKWKVVSPTFCHGYAGLLSLTQEMWKASNDNSLELYRDQLVLEILKYYDVNAPLHFYDFEYFLIKGELKPNTKIGLIDGTIGIILPLLSTVYSNCTWQRAFLIH
ncbi:lanthionine synthetase C family protein [Bacillus sp. IT-79MI2]|uniref:lanthionine synthetase C family protein n=1 Tax=Bacillus TaxID=1386 RepID=UPI0039E1B613